MQEAANSGGLKKILPTYRLPPAAVATSAPFVVVAAPTATHVAVPISVTATSKNNRVIGIAKPGVSCGVKHRGGGQYRHCRECAGDDADQQ
jgi:hypothetical protein